MDFLPISVSGAFPICAFPCISQKLETRASVTPPPLQLAIALKGRHVRQLTDMIDTLDSKTCHSFKKHDESV